MKLKLLLCSAAFAVWSFGVSAQTCVPAPSCSELGFTSAVADCVGSDLVKCPFDKTKVFCRQTKSCEELGFDKTTAQCSGKKTFVCPGDATKVACDDSAMIGEIKLWAGHSIPSGWLACNGQSLSATTYKALYNVIGTTFGGNSTNFYLPNFSGRVPVGIGYGTSTTYAYTMGAKGGEEKHTLTVSEMPSHNHGYTGTYGTGYPDGSGDRTNIGHQNSYPVSSQLKSAGSSSAHENRMPYLAVYYIIYTGVYPDSWTCPVCGMSVSNSTSTCNLCGYVKG